MKTLIIFNVSFAIGILIAQYFIDANFHSAAIKIFWSALATYYLVWIMDKS